MGFPPGTVNVLTRAGETVGAGLCDHPDIDMIGFTGSRELGRRIMAVAAKRIKRISLELGGKNPIIVMPDANVERTSRWLAYAGFLNQGQICSAGSKILVHQSLYEQSIEATRAIACSIRVGDGLAPQTQMQFPDQLPAPVQGSTLRGTRTG